MIEFIERLQLERGYQNDPNTTYNNGFQKGLDKAIDIAEDYVKPTISDIEIKEILLANGFKVKPQDDGTEDLNPYVIPAIRKIIERVT